MKLKTCLLILLSVSCILCISAQKSNAKITLTGTVTDASGIPVANAMVMIDGNNTSSVTNSKGEYKIKIRGDAQIIGIFTFGNGIIEEEIDGRTEINIKFGTSATDKKTDEITESGEEGVNTGYNYIKKKNLTTQIDKIDGTNKKYASYSSIYDMIQRECAGVQVAGGNIVIQGSKNLWGPVPPLLVVDGAYVNSIGNIQPSAVESIEVLKGTAAAMYGSRGYGGVIIIKTKIKN